MKCQNKCNFYTLQILNGKIILNNYGSRIKIAGKGMAFFRQFPTNFNVKEPF